MHPKAPLYCRPNGRYHSFLQALPHLSLDHYSCNTTDDKIYLSMDKANVFCIMLTLHHTLHFCTLDRYLCENSFLLSL